MANPILATAALSDAATMYDPTSAPTNATYLQTQQPGQQWGSGTDPAVIVDLGSNYAINLVALLAHNGSATGTWRIRADDTEAGIYATPTYDETFNLFPSGKPSESWDGLPSLRYDSANLFTARWIRIDVSDASAPSGEFRAGRLIIAAAWQPTVNVNFGNGIGFSDPTTRTESLGGQIWPGEARGVRRTLEMTFGFLTQSEMYSNAFELKRQLGTGGDILACLDPTQSAHLHRETVYGVMSELPPIVIPNLDIYETRFLIEELLP